MIDSYNNPKNDIETGICQELLVSLILFLIYISKIFKEIEKKFPKIVSLSFVNDLGFIVLRI